MKRILVVDDDADILYVVQAALDQAGYRVVALSTAQDMEHALTLHYPDLLLLDIMLADLDGREVCRVLKQHPQHQSIPIILFSASDLHKPDVLACGANDFIAKPFDLDELLATIRNQLPD